MTTKYYIIKTFQDYNEMYGVQYGHGNKGFEGQEVPEITAVIVYSQSNFTREYSETSRSYRVSNTGGKAFFHGMNGNSIYGDCLDGSEYGVRLDAYNWEVEKCYFE